MYPKHYFDLFRDDLDERRVFVGMSFDPDYTSLWENIIRPGVMDAGMEPYRVDMGVINDSIMIDIMKGIQNSRLLLFDISADNHGLRNGNVMYELGLAHAMRNPEEILVMSCNSLDIPFDIAGIRYLKYSRDVNDKDNRELLRVALCRLLEEIHTIRSALIEKVISMMDEVILGFLNSQSQHDLFSGCYQNGEMFSQRAYELRSAIRYMMDLGLLRMVWQGGNQQLYAFKWTPLAKSVMRHLGFIDGQSNSGIESSGQ